MTVTMIDPSTSGAAARRRRTGAVPAVALLLGASLFGGALPASAAPSTITVDGIEYSLDEADPAIGATVIDGGSDANVTVPAQIRYLGVDYTVNTIGVESFDNSGIETVQLPETITAIEKSAFSHTPLREINFPSGLTTIGQFAFTSTQLTSVHLPDSVTAIGENAFLLSTIRQFRLPAGLTAIPDGLFWSNAFPAGTTIGVGNGTNSIPEGVTSIGSSAFGENPGISAVTLPPGLSEVQAQAFQGSSITSLTVPASVTFLGPNSFTTGDTLTEVTFEGTAPRVLIPAGSLGPFGEPRLADLTLWYEWSKGHPTVDQSFSHPEWKGYRTCAHTTISFDTAGHGGAAPAAQRTSTCGTIAEPDPAPTDPGWDFAGWTDSANSGALWDFSANSIGDQTLVAGWSKKAEAVVSFDLQGHGEALEPQRVILGQTATEPTAPAASGYAFTGWFLDAELLRPYDFASPVTGDTVLFAGWKVEAKPVVPTEPPNPPGGNGALPGLGGAGPAGSLAAAAALLIAGAAGLALRSRRRQPVLPEE